MALMALMANGVRCEAAGANGVAAVEFVVGMARDTAEGAAAAGSSTIAGARQHHYRQRRGGWTARGRIALRRGESAPMRVDRRSMAVASGHGPTSAAVGWMSLAWLQAPGKPQYVTYIKMDNISCSTQHECIIEHTHNR